MFLQNYYLFFLVHTACETYHDGSDDELKRLAHQIDDGIYDPFASIQSLQKKQQSQNVTPGTANGTPSAASVSSKTPRQGSVKGSIKGSAVSLGKSAYFSFCLSG